MTEHRDLLERASTRGNPRGMGRVLADARHGLRRRRRQQGFALLVGAALVGAGFMGTGLRSGTTTAVTASQADDFVAVVPDGDRFELLRGSEPEGWKHPASRLGNIAIHQRLHEDGSVAAAVAVGVVTDTREQSTLLDVFPFSGETAEGQQGSYPLAHDDVVTNGLVIVERTTATHTIRVAGRGLDVPATVEILESVELSAEGRITRIALPEGVPADPVYDGPDISRLGILPAQSTAGHYRDLDTGQELTVLTVRDRSVLPAESLAWYFGGTVLSENAPPTLVGEELGSQVAYWRLGPSSSIRLFSDAPLSADLVRRIQTGGRAVDAATWSGMVEDRPSRTDVTTATTSTTSP